MAAFQPYNNYHDTFVEIGSQFYAALPGASCFENKKKAWVDLLSTVLRKEGDIADKGSALFFLQELGIDAGFTCLIPEKKLCADLIKAKDDTFDFHNEVSLGLCEQLVATALKAKHHKERRHALDQAIKRLLRLDQQARDNFHFRVRLTLSKAYYLRGKIIRPKGFTVPSKKIETLHIAEEILATLVELNETKTAEAKRLRAMIHIDLAALQAKTDKKYRQILTAAITDVKDAATSEIDEVLIILARGEDDTNWSCDSGKDILKQLLKNPVTQPLQKARAYCLLDLPTLAVTHANEAVKVMSLGKTPFSHDDWRLLVFLLRTLKKRKAQGIDTLILYTWGKICRLEQQTKSGLHVRWYWSRQRDLYDLAFHAATDLETKAKIADSLKARPALHLAQAADIGLAVEQMENGLLDRYIHDMGTETQNSDNAPKPDWKALPAPWIAVHFYLSNGFGHPEEEKNGYVLILNSQTGEWTEKIFPYQSLWAAYMNWQENYQLMKEKAAPDLERLCRTMGQTMPFLFEEELFPDERPVIFIPHEFLHRLPLHAALSDKKYLFAAKHSFTYLPAWWMKYADNADSPKQTSPALALMHWKEASAKIIVDLVKDKQGTVREDAKASDWPGDQKARLKILYCHGKASTANPFASRLMLDGGGLSLQKILAGEPLAGRFILGACETDLVLPAVASLDEHFSISTGLLQRGAKEVLGTLWEVHENDVYDLLSRTIPEDSPTAFPPILKDWSGVRMDVDDDEPFEQRLYAIAAFRTLGLSL